MEVRTFVEVRGVDYCVGGKEPLNFQTEMMKGASYSNAIGGFCWRFISVLSGIAIHLVFQTYICT